MNDNDWLLSEKARVEAEYSVLSNERARVTFKINTGLKYLRPLWRLIKANERQEATQ